MILIIDNYDSFTYNLYQYLSELGADVRVVRNDRATVAETIGHPVGAGIALLLIAAMYYHLKLGIQVVVEDYVHGAAAKIALLMGNTFACAVLGVLSALSVLKLAFGG